MTEVRTLDTSSMPSSDPKTNITVTSAPVTDHEQSKQASDAMPLGSYPPSGVNVLIVGTGLAGLAATIECIRKGHNVTILERNSTVNTAGDMYFMGLSATRFLKHWPEMAKEYDEISLHNTWIETYKHSGEQMIKPLKVSERLKAAGLDPNTPPGTFQMRPLIYKMFLHQLERLEVDIQYNKRVIDFEEDEAKGTATAITDAGERYEADIIIAADGVGSKSQRLVGREPRARSSGRAMWRAAFPKEHLDKNPAVKEFFAMAPGESGDEPIVRTFLGPNMYALTLTRPDVMVWVMNHDASGSETESWSNTVGHEEVLKGMDQVPSPEPWSPMFADLVKCTPPDTIINFELLWRDPQPSWTSPAARLVQIGDGAHSFLPSSGNGATQAIEDAISIASCLQVGAQNGEIPASVRAHVKMRFVRCACAQKLGFSNAELLQDTDWSKVKLDPRKAAPKHPKWVFAHDPEAYVYKNYDAVVEGVRNGIALEDDPRIEPNYPPGYKFTGWSIDEIMDDVKAGREVTMGPGNWD